MNQKKKKKKKNHKGSQDSEANKTPGFTDSISMA
jgi:hypothetical protein